MILTTSRRRTSLKSFRSARSSSPNGLEMASVNRCKSGEFFFEGRCCDLCPPGKRVVAECNQDSPTTVCEKCKHEEYLADSNFIRNCAQCRVCLSNSNMRTATECQAEQNRQCECESGYYFIDKEMEHCALMTKCPPGSGVKVHATIGNDTICAPCPPGTYSPMTDLSPCRPHTRCKELGQELKSPGTKTTDATCGPLKHPGCSWMLPASLWAGLVVTAVLIVLLCVLYRWMKRNSNHTALFSRCSLTVEPVAISETRYPCPELGEYCQESRDEDKSLRPIFVNSGSSLLVNPYHHHGNTQTDGPPKTLLTDRSGQSTNDMNGHATISLVKIPSEPQEDEWRGT